MFELAIEEIKNQIRIIDQKLPSIDESIKTYEQMAKNCQREKDVMLEKKQQLLDITEFIYKGGK